MGASERSLGAAYRHAELRTGTPQDRLLALIEEKIELPVTGLRKQDLLRGAKWQLRPMTAVGAIIGPVAAMAFAYHGMPDAAFLLLICLGIAFGGGGACLFILLQAMARCRYMSWRARMNPAQFVRLHYDGRLKGRRDEAVRVLDWLVSEHTESAAMNMFARFTSRPLRLPGFAPVCTRLRDELIERFEHVERRLRRLEHDISAYATDAGPTLHDEIAEAFEDLNTHVEGLRAVAQYLTSHAAWGIGDVPTFLEHVEIEMRRLPPLARVDLEPVAASTEPTEEEGFAVDDGLVSGSGTDAPPVARENDPGDDWR